MTTQAQQYEQGFARQSLNDIQRKAVADYLTENREIERDFAYNEGLPACGRIKNLGGRIHELRHEGWSIRTETDRGDHLCYYVLVSEPPAQQLPLSV
jgi:hypothetical protein